MYIYTYVVCKSASRALGKMGGNFWPAQRIRNLPVLGGADQRCSSEEVPKTHLGIFKYPNLAAKV